MSASATFNAWAIPWAEFMWSGLIDATLLLAIVALLWLPLRRRMSAQVGYCLFLLILVKLVVPIHVTAPGWLANLSPRNVIGGLTAWSAAPNAQVVPEAAELSLWELSPPELSPGAGASGEPGSGSSPLERIAGSPLTLPAVAAAPPLSLYAKLMLGWMVVVAVLFLRFVWVQGRMQRVIRQAMPLDPAALPVDFDGLRQLAGVRQPVHLVASPGLATPAVWGLFRPQLLLPPDLLQQLTANQLTWVLLHELAHIRRADLVVALVQRCVQIVYFFHPAVWLANWLIDHEREYACDDAALAACPFPRRDCGQGFLRIVERANAQPITIAPALGLFDGFFTYKTFIRSRLMRILDTQRSVRPGLSVGSTAFLLAMGVVVLPHLQAQQTKQDPQPVAQETAAKPQTASGTSIAQAAQAGKTTPTESAALAATTVREPIVKELKVPPEVTGVQFVFSPKGRKVAYYADWGYRELRVFDLDTGATASLVQASREESVGLSGVLVWSPKGDQVVFDHATKEDYSIRVVPAAGGKARTIYAPPELFLTPQDWSKDGKWILAKAQRKDKTQSYLLVPVEGGEPQQLLSVGWDDTYFPGAFSPDAKLVLYVRTKDGQPGVFLFDLASRREIHAAAGVAPTWSHDGRYFLFRRDKSRDLWAQRIKDNVPAGEPFVVKQDSPGYRQNLTGSSVQVLDDGRLLYWTMVGGEQTHLFAAAIDTETGEARGQPTVFAQPVGVPSPDGRQVMHRGLEELRFTSLDGKEVRQVPTEVWNPFEYSWFPDGKSVLTGGYIGRDKGPGKRGLFQIDVTTGKAQTLIARDSFISNARLSPDGQHVAFGMRDKGEGMGLYVMKPEPDAKPTLLCRGLKGGSISLAWSPDGTSIVFVGGTPEDDGGRVLVIPAVGGDPKELVVQTSGWLHGLAWSPNGRFITYIRDQDLRPDSPTEIWIVSAEGGPAVHLRELDEYRPTDGRGCTWSADGKLIFAGQPEPPPERHVWSMENYLPAE